MSKTSLVLTILGDDRPGLVEPIARVVADHGGNWLESRMAHLAGQFAGILRVEVDADHAEALAAALRGLRDAGLESIIHPDAVGADAGRTARATWTSSARTAPASSARSAACSPPRASTSRS